MRVKKPVIGTYSSPQGHWVGDGFPVRSLFSYDKLGKHVSPFLLLDYAGPMDFAPATQPRGVGEHPHRGFETVTIVYQGEVAHRDSAGNGGLVGPGDVQWMTAAAGILHEEFHSPAFSSTGGALEMVQLWVNLPSRDKMSAPRYQTLLNANIPQVPLPGGAGNVRVIAGNYGDFKGAAATYSALNVWDVRLSAGAAVNFDVPPGHTAALAVLRGRATLNGADVKAVGLAVLDREGDEVSIEATETTSLLFLSGAPLDEPIVGYGPFVMNSRQEIETAMRDFQSGKFGRMPAREATPA